MKLFLTQPMTAMSARFLWSTAGHIHVGMCVCTHLQLHMYYITYHVFMIQDRVLRKEGLTDILYMPVRSCKVLFTQDQILRTCAHM